MIRCIIVDDELKSRESLRILLEDFVKDVRVMALCQNINEGYEAITNLKPDVVFLDVQMQRETGFDLLAKFDSIPFEVVFTTAHAEYAIKAFKFSAIDYLMKPIDIQDLSKALDKVRKRLKHDMTAQLEMLVKNLKSPNEKIFKLALPANDGLVFVKVEDILYCEAASNYTTFYMQDDKKYIVSRTLKEYEELLANEDFFRIHNSYLINLKALKRYVRGEGGYVVMNNDKALDVSKRKKDSFLNRIGFKDS